MVSCIFLFFFQSLIEAVTVKRQSFTSLQELAKTILEIPSSSHSDKESVKSRSEKMAKEWQFLFRSLPLNVQVISLFSVLAVMVQHSTK